MIAGYRKRKNNIMLRSKSLSANLSYNRSQFAHTLSLNCFALNKNNTDSKNNFCKELI